MLSCLPYWNCDCMTIYFLNVKRYIVTKMQKRIPHPSLPNLPEAHRGRYHCHQYMDSIRLDVDERDIRDDSGILRYSDYNDRHWHRFCRDELQQITSVHLKQLLPLQRWP